jgi:hypothetical protein
VHEVEILHKGLTGPADVDLFAGWPVILSLKKSEEMDQTGSFDRKSGRHNLLSGQIRRKRGSEEDVYGITRRH